MKPLWIVLLVLMLGIGLGCNSPGSSDEPDEAILQVPPYAAWTDSIGRFPSRGYYYYERGLLLETNHDSLLALRDFRKAVALVGQPDFVVGLADFWLNHGQVDSARLLLLPAVRRYPYNQLLERDLLMAYYDNEQYQEALTVNDSALSYDSASSGNWYNRGMILDALHDSAQSLSCFEKAYGLDPDRATIAYELAVHYAGARDPKTIALCDEIIREDGQLQKPDPYVIKGIYYENVGNVPQALKSFDQAIQIDYTFLEAYLEKGILLFKQKRYADALQVFDLSIRINDTFADGYYWKGRCQKEMNKPGDARLNFERAIAFDKHFTEAREALHQLDSATSK